MGLGAMSWDEARLPFPVQQSSNVSSISQPPFPGMGRGLGRGFGGAQGMMGGVQHLQQRGPEDELSWGLNRGRMTDEMSSGKCDLVFPFCPPNELDWCFNYGGKFDCQSGLRVHREVVLMYCWLAQVDLEVQATLAVACQGLEIDPQFRWAVLFCRGSSQLGHPRHQIYTACSVGPTLSQALGHSGEDLGGFHLRSPLGCPVTRPPKS